jgi:hypothetical protein
MDPQWPVQGPHRQPLREQLRRRRADAERRPAGALGTGERGTSLPDPRAEARRADRHGLGGAARALLRQSRRGRPGHRARPGHARGAFRGRRRVATGVRRGRPIAGRRLRLGPPHLLTAPEGAVEPGRRRSFAGRRRRHAGPRARHVRARVPPGFRRECHRVHRRVHAQHRLDRRRRAHGRGPGRPSAAAGGPVGQEPALDVRRGARLPPRAG